jgi:hypothetical protein
MSTSGFIWSFASTTSRRLEFGSLRCSTNTNKKEKINSDYSPDQ